MINNEPNNQKDNSVSKWKNILNDLNDLNDLYVEIEI